MKIEIRRRVRPGRLSATTKLLSDVLRAARPHIQKRLGMEVGVGIHTFYLGPDIDIRIIHEVNDTGMVLPFSEEKKCALIAAVRSAVKPHLKKHKYAKIAFIETRVTTN